MTGGRLIVGNEPLPPPTGGGAPRRIRLFPYLLLAALAFYLADLALRKRPLLSRNQERD